MPYKYRDLKWSEMTDKQQKRAGSESEHKAAKQKAQAKAQQKDSSPPPSSTTSSESSNNRVNALSDIRGVSFDNVETIAPGASSPSAIAADKALNTKYSKMSDEYKSTTTKAQHKDARKAAGTYTNNRQESFNVDSLDDFDRTATGRGSDTGEDRLSVTELENMRDIGGFSEQEIYDYATSGSAADSKRGTEAQKLLDSFKTQLTTPTPEPTPLPEVTPEPTPVPTPEPTPEPQPEPTPEPTPEPDSQEFLNDRIGEIIDNGGNANVQDVTIDMSNEQNQSIDMDNDLGSTVRGDDNATAIDADNTATNIGGNQGNSAVVSNSNESGAQDFLADRVTAITDNAGQGGSTANLNLQEVDITEQNIQNQDITMDNDLDSRVEGDYNTTLISVDNSASNVGGDQINSSTVTNSNSFSGNTQLPISSGDSGQSALTDEQRFAGDAVASFDSEKFYAERPDVLNAYNTDEGAADDARVAEMNKMYGTNHDDLRDFSKEEFGNWHTNFHSGAYEQGGKGGDYYTQSQPTGTEESNQPVAESSETENEGQAQDLLGDYVGSITGNSSSGAQRGQDLTDPNYFINRQDVDSSQTTTQTQSANQNNDLNSTITGDNNFTQISQDNSVRNYGGDQRSFTYVSNSDNPYTDTPASMATLAGFNSVTDSPAATASKVDMYQTLNRDAQKRYDNAGMANEMINRGNNIFNVNAFEDAIALRPEVARARADQGLLKTFGDYRNFPQFNFQMPKAPEPIDEFDAEELYNKFS